MTLTRSVRLITFLLFVFSAVPTVFAHEAPLNELDAYVSKALRDREVPGVFIGSLDHWHYESIEGAPAGVFVQFEMAEGKVKSLSLVQGSGPSFTLSPKP